MGKKRVGCLGARVGQERCIGRGGPDGPGCAVEVYKLEKPEEEVTVLKDMGPPGEVGAQQRGQLRE